MERFAPVRDPNAPPPEPRIIGTGFVVREDGIIATNDHVIRAFGNAVQPPGRPGQEWPVYARVLQRTEAGILEIPVDLLGIIPITIKHRGVHYAKEKPDIALVQIDAGNLPPLKIDPKPVLEGVEVATAGYPMGTDALVAPGWFQQAGPTLQRGIVSAVFPFACPSPEGFAVNIMIQGGASGSPVFYTDSGAVAGVLYASLFDVGRTAKGDLYRSPTNISYVVPSHYLKRTLDILPISGVGPVPKPSRSLEQLIAKGEVLDKLRDAPKVSIIKAVVPPS